MEIAAIPEPNTRVSSAFSKDDIFLDNPIWLGVLKYRGYISPFLYEYAVDIYKGETAPLYNGSSIWPS